MSTTGGLAVSAFAAVLVAAVAMRRVARSTDDDDAFQVNLVPIAKNNAGIGSNVPGGARTGRAPRDSQLPPPGPLMLALFVCILKFIATPSSRLFNALYKWFGMRSVAQGETFYIGIISALQTHLREQGYMRGGTAWCPELAPILATFHSTDLHAAAKAVYTFMHTYVKMHTKPGDPVLKLFDTHGSCVYGFAYLRYIHGIDSTQKVWKEANGITGARHAKTAHALQYALAQQADGKDCFISFTPSGPRLPSALPPFLGKIFICVPKNSNWTVSTSKELTAYMQAVLLFTIGLVTDPIKLDRELAKDFAINVDRYFEFAVDSDTITGVTLEGAVEKSAQLANCITLAELNAIVALRLPHAVHYASAEILPMIFRAERDLASP